MTISTETPMTHTIQTMPIPAVDNTFSPGREIHLGTPRCKPGGFFGPGKKELPETAETEKKRGS